MAIFHFRWCWCKLLSPGAMSQSLKWVCGTYRSSPLPWQDQAADQRTDHSQDGDHPGQGHRESAAWCWACPPLSPRGEGPAGETTGGERGTWQRCADWSPGSDYCSTGHSGHSHSVQRTPDNRSYSDNVLRSLTLLPQSLWQVDDIVKWWPASAVSDHPGPGWLWRQWSWWSSWWAGCPCRWPCWPRSSRWSARDPVSRPCQCHTVPTLACWTAQWPGRETGTRRQRRHCSQSQRQHDPSSSCPCRQTWASSPPPWAPRMSSCPPSHTACSDSIDSSSLSSGWPHSRPPWHNSKCCCTRIELTVGKMLDTMDKPAVKNWIKWRLMSMLFVTNLSTIITVFASLLPTHLTGPVNHHWSLLCAPGPRSHAPFLLMLDGCAGQGWRLWRLWQELRMLLLKVMIVMDWLRYQLCFHQLRSGRQDGETWVELRGRTLGRRVGIWEDGGGCGQVKSILILHTVHQELSPTAPGWWIVSATDDWWLRVESVLDIVHLLLLPGEDVGLIRTLHSGIHIQHRHSLNIDILSFTTKWMKFRITIAMLTLFAICVDLYVNFTSSRKSLKRPSFERSTVTATIDWSVLSQRGR